MFFSLQKPGLTIARSLTGRGGVFGFDFTIDSISKVMREQNVSADGSVFLMDQLGRLIAHSKEDVLKVRYSGQSIQLTPAADVDDPVVNAANLMLNEAEQKGATHQLETIAGVPTLLHVTKIGKELGISYFLAVAAPLSNFTEHIKRMQYRSIVLTLIALLLAIIAILLIARIIAKAITKLAVEAEKISRLELDDDFTLKTRILEIHTLSDALARMQAGLSSFRRFVPADLVRRILALGEEARLGGEVRDVTILFSDLRGYSTLIEKLTPEMVITFMNLYFQAMQDVISEYGGVLLELQGDGILAVFGAPDTLPDHATAATHCAIAMREQLEPLNMRLQQTYYAGMGGFDGRLELFHRIGIHTGRVVAGNIGGQSYMKYGVVGDVVNVAARLEQLHKQYDTSLLVSSEVYGSLPIELRSDAEDRGTIRLKGREQPQHVYSL